MLKYVTSPGMRLIIIPDQYDILCLTLFTVMIIMVNSTCYPQNVEGYVKLTQTRAKAFMRRCL